MVNKCVAPNCRTGYDKTSKEKGSGDGSKRNFTDHPLHVYHFPKEKELFERWKHAVPRKDWEPSKNSVLCEKHFLPTDFKGTEYRYKFFSENEEGEYIGQTRVKGRCNT